jgi:hypothetical protein
MNIQSCRKTDRVSPRSASIDVRSSRQLNVSIHALSSDRKRLNQTGANLLIDIVSNQAFTSAIELTARIKNSKIMNLIVTHIQSGHLSLNVWFAGACVASRRHPWDEQKLSFSTKAWIVIPTEAAEEAQKVAKQLFDFGCRKPPVHTESPAARCVFAYALNEESLN